MKIKKLLILLSLVCAVFFSFGISASAGYEVGDKIEGIEITMLNNTELGWDYYIYVGNHMYLFDSSDVYLSLSTSNNKYNIYRTDCCYASGTVTDGVVKFQGYNTTPRSGKVGTSTYSSSEIVASNFNLYDADGKMVFPPPLQAVPGLEGITTELLLMVLTELKPIILGLIVSVVGFIAFRKAWLWVLAMFSHG